MGVGGIPEKDEGRGAMTGEESKLLQSSEEKGQWLCKIVIVSGPRDEAWG